MIDNAIETNCDALRTMLILPQPANCFTLRAFVSWRANDRECIEIRTWIDLP